MKDEHWDAYKHPHNPTWQVDGGSPGHDDARFRHWDDEPEQVDPVDDFVDITPEQLREYELSHCDNPWCENEPMVLHDWDEWECPCCGKTWPNE